MITWFDTAQVLLTVGADTGGTEQNAFDNALRKGGIESFNLIKVSSIIPPNVPVLLLREGAQSVSGDGRMVPTIFEAMTSDVVGSEIAAAVGVALPSELDRAASGIGFVTSCRGPKGVAEQRVRSMLKEGAERRGLIDHREIVVAVGVVVSAPWTCALAAALFCDDDIRELFEPGSFVRSAESP